MIKNKGWQRVLGIIIPFIFIVSIFQFLAYKIAKVNIKNKGIGNTTEQDLIIQFFNLFAAFLTIWLFTKFIDKEKFINLGFNIKNRIKELLSGFLVGVFIISIGFIILLLSQEIIYLKTAFNFKEIFFLIIIFIIVSFVEETLFRGYILKNLMISFNKYIALIVSSLLFALIHSANPNMSLFSFANLFLAGIFLGISYIYTKNLWFPIALHFSWNLTQTLLGFNVSGKDIYSIIEFKITEKNYLNGGDFGFEGSILSVFFQIIFIVLIFLYYRKQKN